MTTPDLHSQATALAAHVERLDIHAKSCAIELAAMIDRYNTQNMEDGSWEYDHQTPHDLMMALRDSPETSLAMRDARVVADALEPLLKLARSGGGSAYMVETIETNIDHLRHRASRTPVNPREASDD